MTATLTLPQVLETIDLLLAEQHRCWDRLGALGEAAFGSVERDQLVARGRQLEHEVTALYQTKRAMQAARTWQAAEATSRRADRMTTRRIDQAFTGLRKQWFRQQAFMGKTGTRDRKRTLSWREMSGLNGKRRAA